MTEHAANVAKLDLGTLERCDLQLAPHTAESMRRITRIALSVPASQVREYGCPPCLQAGIVTAVFELLDEAVGNADVSEDDKAHLAWFYALLSRREHGEARENDDDQ